MKLHRTSGKPDWHGLKSAQMNIWQRSAAHTNGYGSPANVITTLGLILVVYGLLLVAQKHYVAGLLVVALGRICDVLDGLVAEATHTKSPLGEALDAGFDKLASLAALGTLAATAIVPWAVAGLILLPNLVNSALTVVAQRKNITLHPSKYGKLFMAYSWASLLTFVLIASTHTHSSLYRGIAYILLIISLALGAKAAADYTKTIKSAAL